MEKVMLIFFIFSLFTNSSKAQTLVVRVDTIFNYNPSTNTYLQINKLVPSLSGQNGKVLGTLDGSTYSWVAVQSTLVSGTNIKTINGTTLLGSGDLTIGGTVTNALSIGAELISGGASSYNGSAAKTLGIQPASVTNAMLVNTAVGNLSGTNTGDNAVNSLYSGLVSNATHTGDATGSTALTLATVNGNVGSFGSATQVGVFTVNAKGLITAASNTTIAIAESQVTGLVTDLVGKQATITTGTTLQYFRGDLSLATFPTTTASFTSSTNKNFVTDAQLTVIGNTSGTNTGDQTITLTGDITGSGTGSFATTLATVASAGTTGSSTAIPVITINAKGLTTSITTAAVIAPAGTLTGATLASGVTASSLTSFGASIILGTPASGTLTNATGLPISTGVSGLGAGIAAFLATPSSANLITAVTNETGNGNLVFSNSPALVTPSIDAATGVSVSLTGNSKWNGYSVTIPVIVTPTTGQTVAASATEWTIVNPAGTLANLGITMSNSPVDGQQIIFSFRTAITALTQVAGTGGAAIDTVTTAAAKSWVVWGYSSSLNRWVLK